MHVMLTVSIGEEASEQALQDFYGYMHQQGWTRLNPSTTFRAQFEDRATRVGAIATARGDVRKAAATAGIQRFEAAAEVGPEPPAVWDDTYL